MMFELNKEGRGVNRKRVQRLMRVMGIEALVPRPGTSKAAPGHKIYPYLLRGVTITEPNHVWAADITYIPMAHGFLYLVAIIDWASRAVLAWRLSNTMETSFCLAALGTKLWLDTANRGFSILTREPSSPAPRSPASLKPLASRFRWTGADVSWTTSSSNGCGARSSMKRCI
jgi:transposase InsO family protein